MRGDKARPKCITYKDNGSRILFDSYQEMAGEVKGDNDHLVIVEDIISAIKVGRYAHTIAILGSYLSSLLTTKALGHKRITLWLDDDKYDEAIRMAQRLRQLGKPTMAIKSKYDPKECSDSFIQTQLSGRS